MVDVTLVAPVEITALQVIIPQIALFRSLICTGARRNPTACGIYPAVRQRRFDLARSRLFRSVWRERMKTRSRDRASERDRERETERGSGRERERKRETERDTVERRPVRRESVSITALQVINPHIALFRSLICSGARCNPAACGTHPAIR